MATTVEKVGGEFLVNTQTAGTQWEPTITALSNGGFVVSWEDFSSFTLGDSSTSSIKAQIYNSAGSKIGDEFLVNTQTPNEQGSPSITALSGGGFVVTWDDRSGTLGDASGASVKAQIFGATGTRIGSEFLVNTQTTSFQDSPSITGLSNGSFVVAWVDGGSGDGSGSSVKAQLFSASGLKIGGEFVVNTQAANNQTAPSVTSLTAGGFVVAWTDLSLTLGDASLRSVKAQVLDANGAKVGGEFLVNTQTFSNQSASVIAGLANGGFVVSWEDQSGTLGDASPRSIKAQIFSASGVKSGTEFLVNTQTLAGQIQPSLVALSNGGFVISWMDQSGTLGDASGTSVKAQAFNASGGRVGGEFLVNSQTTENQEAPTIAALVDGRFVISWQDTSGTLGDASGASIKAQIFRLNQDPIITSGGGGATAAVTVPDDQVFVTNVAASDPNSDTLTYSIAGGADAALFSINATTGELRFLAQPDFAAPADLGGNNVYDVTVRASDGTLFDDQAIAVTVIDDNEPPVITSGGGGATAAVTVPDDQVFVTNVSASDPDADTLTYSIAGGADAALFSIDATTGELRFQAQPDFAAPADAGADNVYDVTVRASDGTLFDDQAIAVTVIDDLRASTRAVKVGGEFLVNTQTAGDQYEPTVTGLSNGGFVVSWTDFSGTLGDTDLASVKAQLFNAAGIKIGSEFLVNTQTASSQYNPTISALTSGGFVVSWEDSSRTLGDTSDLSIRAQIFDAAGTKLGGEFLVNTQASSAQYQPTITGLSTGGFVISWTDLSGTLGDADLGSVKAQLFDAAGNKFGSEFLVNTRTTSYQISPAITSLSNGGFVISWQDNIGMPGDDINYNIKAQVFDAGGNRIGSEIHVNTMTGISQYYPTIVGLNSGGFVVSWTDFSGTLGDMSDGSIKAQVFDALGTKVGSEFLVNTQTASGQYEPAITAINSGGFIVSWWDFSGTLGDVSGSSIKAQVFDAVGSKVGNEFLVNTQTSGSQAQPMIAGLSNGDIVVSWSDSSGTLGDSSLTSIKAQIFRLANNPIISSDGGGDTAAVAFNENDIYVTEVEIANPGDPVTYSISGGADAALFTIEADTGYLAFIESPNFEVPTDDGENGVYDVVVRATSGGLFDEQAIAVTVNDANDAPYFLYLVPGFYFITTSELNPYIDGFDAADEDPGTTLVYSIDQSENPGVVTIDSATGVVTFNEPQDYDANPDLSYFFVVQVSDGIDYADIPFVISFYNENEQPAIVSGGGGDATTALVDENQTAVTTISADDPDAGTMLTFSITGGADAGKFTIDAATGALAFLAAPDFETPADADGDGVYDVIVRSSDVALFDEQAIAVTVSNVNEAPVITSNGGGAAAAVSVAENQTAAALVAAADPDAGTTLTFSITGGADAALFEIDADTGALRFIAAPNFESPADADSDGVYDVTVQASDGSLFDEQAIAVTVSNVNEAPAITSNGGGATASLSTAENQTAVTVVTASDIDFGATLTFTLTGGADAALFEIDAATGALRFKTAPDFEARADADGDGVYDVVVRASDGSLFDDQALAVTVTDVGEGPTRTYTGTSAADSFAVSDGEGWRISGLAGNDTLTGGSNTDVIIGGRGLDIVAGGGGNDDFLVGLSDGFDSVDGGDGFDRILATAANVIIGLSSISGIEAISGGGFAGVSILGTSAANVFDFSGVTLTGITRIDAGSGNDTVTGSALDDVIVMGSGNDILAGGGGNDIFLARSSAGRDSIDGGDGFDTIRADVANTKIQLASFSGIELISSGGFAGVTILGSSAGETMDFSAIALDGIASINGGSGNDTIIGSAGADRIIGGSGADILTGGDGADVFAYLFRTESGRGVVADIITDFVSGVDKIDLTAVDANALIEGLQSFTFIGTDAFTDVGQLRVGLDTNGQVALFGNISGSLTPEMQITLTGAPPIVVTDLIL